MAFGTLDLIWPRYTKPETYEIFVSNFKQAIKMHNEVLLEVMTEKGYSFEIKDLSDKKDKLYTDIALNTNKEWYEEQENLDLIIRACLLADMANLRHNKDKHIILDEKQLVLNFSENDEIISAIRYYLFTENNNGISNS